MLDVINQFDSTCDPTRFSDIADFACNYLAARDDDTGLLGCVGLTLAAWGLIERDDDQRWTRTNITGLEAFCTLDAVPVSGFPSDDANWAFFTSPPVEPGPDNEGLDERPAKRARVDPGN